ncbi:LuxR C-terminal-related transcriptional regulator [Catellatospora sp. TT07R-123]|uniref:helix-turn-helix transcriptional regulator n=1 Tax=Catellatospora sp. TT07R-123 TaxID=2733863 RepID=UPI001BB3080B|nr:LuxR C-terminal-related transcriptional regulator [Catellatospora sp. TT07R-123]
MDASAISTEERLMVEMIITDHGDEQIASQLNVAVRTMQRHLRALMDRVGAPNRGALCAIATFYGWIDMAAILMNELK